MDTSNLERLTKEELIKLIQEYQHIFNNRFLLWESYRNKYLSNYIESNNSTPYVTIDLTTGQTKNEELSFSLQYKGGLASQQQGTSFWL